MSKVFNNSYFYNMDFTQSSMIFIRGLIAILFVHFHFLASGHVVLDYPEGGEVFVFEQNIIIKWHEEIEHNTQNFDLYFSSDDGETWEEIVLDLPESAREYDWKIPETPTEVGRIKVIQDNEDLDYSYVSDQFSIRSELVTSVSNGFESAWGMNNHPNPFVENTTINYILDQSGYVTLLIYDSNGRVVRVLKSEKQTPGEHHIKWNGETSAGRPLAPGVYICRLIAERKQISVTLVKQ